MTNQHPITPPPELVEQWEAETAHTTKDEIWHVAVQAAQWGADQGLEACCEWTAIVGGADALRAARRPKPPSLKEQALYLLANHSDRWTTSPHDRDLICRALEALDD